MSAKSAKKKRSQREPITEMEPVHPIVDWDKIYHKKTIQLEFTVRKDATPEEIEGFTRFMETFKATIPIEKAAVDTL